MNRTGGRPAFSSTKEQRRIVCEMCAHGVPQDVIANVIDIAPKTLRLHFRNELDIGSTLAIVKVAEALFQKAMNGDVACMIFFLKTRGRWTTQSSTQDDNYLDADPTTLSDAELNAQIARLRRSAVDKPPDA